MENGPGRARNIGREGGGMNHLKQHVSRERYTTVVVEACST
jgi:hypothetical protein